MEHQISVILSTNLFYGKKYKNETYKIIREIVYERLNIW